MEVESFQDQKYMIDVKENEKEVLEYLHSLDFEERSNILSPEKEVWFKYYHYLRFLNHPSYAAEKRGKFYWYQYQYCKKNQMYQSKPLELITLDQLKEMTAYLKKIPIKNNGRRTQKI